MRALVAIITAGQMTVFRFAQAYKCCEYGPGVVDRLPNGGGEYIITVTLQNCATFEPAAGDCVPDGLKFADCPTYFTGPNRTGMITLIDDSLCDFEIPPYNPPTHVADIWVKCDTAKEGGSTTVDIWVRTTLNGSPIATLLSVGFNFNTGYGGVVPSTIFMTCGSTC